MSTVRSLPKLAAMFLTEGHRVPAELLSSAALDAPPASAEHPLNGWECPLEAGRAFGVLKGSGDVRMRPPEY